MGLIKWILSLLTVFFGLGRDESEMYKEVVAPKIRPNLLALARMLTFIELVLTVGLFVLVWRVLMLADKFASTGVVVDAAGNTVVNQGAIVEIVLTAAGVAALFAAWLIIIGTIVGGLVSTMSQVAEDKDPPPPNHVQAVIDLCKVIIERLPPALGQSNTERQSNE